MSTIMKTQNTVRFSFWQDASQYSLRFDFYDFVTRVLYILLIDYAKIVSSITVTKLYFVCIRVKISVFWRFRDVKAASNRNRSTLNDKFN